MSTGARSTGSTQTGGQTHAHDHDHDGRTPAQWYCLLGGLALLLAGILGFLVESSFKTGDALERGSLLGFDINGWHNVVHLLSGVVLLAAAAKWRTAKTVAIAFGAVYGLVTIIGIIDGEDLLSLLPINAADNVLHIALAALGIIAGVISRPKRDDHR
ncbi:MAG: DUF4383 domain-containing protein [Actinomycetota bacterium]|nr:DUF4383 domain-containing protein [Actinomycetota bacterium]